MALSVSCHIASSAIPKLLPLPKHCTRACLLRLSQTLNASRTLQVLPHLIFKPKAASKNWQLLKLEQTRVGLKSRAGPSSATMAKDGIGPSRGAFVVLEGLDRSGKSTQVQKLVEV